VPVVDAHGGARVHAAAAEDVRRGLRPALGERGGEAERAQPQARMAPERVRAGTAKAFSRPARAATSVGGRSSILSRNGQARRASARRCGKCW
jgi:hypothetical protein